ALRRYFVNTKNGVEKSSSIPFSIDPCFFTIIWTTCFLLIMCFIHGAGAEYFIQISFVHENGTVIFMTKKRD
ncbi:MAG: hypothetical protein ACIRZM_06195, partial [Ligilactobacillus ruminis]